MRKQGRVEIYRWALPLGNETLLSVSSGVGMTKIPARLGVPPEILYYHLEPQQKFLNCSSVQLGKISDSFQQTFDSLIFFCAYRVKIY